LIGRSKLWIGAVVLVAGAALGKWASDGGLALTDAGSGPAPESSDVPTLATQGMEPRVAAALEAARRDVLADLRSSAAWGRYGIVLDAHDLDVEATAAYRVAHRLDPKEFRWVYFLGRTSEFGGGAGEEAAETLFLDAISLRPDYAPTYVRLGDNLVRQGRIEEARDAFKRALELDPGLGKAHRGLGQAQLALGHAPEALPHLERAAQLVPQDGAAQASLARAYTLTGDRTRAREAAERSRTLDQIHTFPDPVTLEVGDAGTSASVCFRRARELMEFGNFRAAIPNLRIALENLTQNPFIHSRLGRCYVESCRTARAPRQVLGSSID
jgi:tetratricopeptide (TPR) repeat protein